MKSIKLALMGGAALAVTSAAAHADDLDALKAQIETLNARVAAMEAAPAVPAGYSLLTISEGPRSETPGLPLTSQEAAGYGNEATYISVLPTADAPAGATISWSGYARAGVRYVNTKDDLSLKDANGEELEVSGSTDSDDTDIPARGQLRVKASTDTAVGEVGVDIRLRANFDGNGSGDVYSDVAWGYWSMTPELTFGGGYAGSLGNIGYGYDGACTCYLTDSADVGFNPGDTTQLRLSYASGPFSMALAVEDATVNSGWVGNGGNTPAHGTQLGAAGEVKYSGDVVNGEVSGVWRDREESPFGGDALWQIGAGLAFSLGDMASLSLGAAFGEGPFELVASNSSPNGGEITNALPINQSWWGISGLASANLSDSIHAEIGAGYKSRDGDNAELSDGTDTFDTDLDRTSWGVLGGIYYDPVDQLTLGIEAEYWENKTDGSFELEGDPAGDLEFTNQNFQVDFVSVWRF
ncbi:MAG: porin [Aestuariivirga sp.]|uniref:porin n=1 Tax=Aestuariivirga sp. TaxID=2650926 RepID=UPI0038D18D0E